MSDALPAHLGQLSPDHSPDTKPEYRKPKEKPDTQIQPLLSLESPLQLFSSVSWNQQRGTHKEHYEHK